MNLLNKLLHKQIAPIQTVGLFLANLLGTTVILSGIQFYFDVAPSLSSKESFMKEEYLIISKHIEPSGSAFGKTYTFSPEEIQEIRQQPFVRKADLFQSSLFSISAGLGMKSTGLYFSTEMFFEAVPDQYIDVDSDKWYFNPDNTEIPIIIPRNYLNLYNFGFAQSQGLPKLSEEMATALQLEIQLQGAGISETKTGRVVGFSNRLNTILVPETFLTWANHRFAPEKTAEPARLIIETEPTDNTALTKFLQTKGYETENGKADQGKTVYFLKLITIIVASIGTIICLLSLFLLLLSLSLLLQEDRFKIKTLLLIGYNVKQIARPYQQTTVTLNSIVLVVAISLTLLLRNFYLKEIKILFPQWNSEGVGMMIIAGLGIWFILSLLNAITIHHKVQKIGVDKS